MSYNDLFPRSALLAAKDEISNKNLFTDKITKENLPDGFFFFFLETSCPRRHSILVRDCIDKILSRERYSNSAENLPFFEELISHINDELFELSKKDVDIWRNNFNAIVGLIDKHQVFISQTGKTFGYLFRKNKISTILDLTDEPIHPVKTFVNITSGQLALNDRLIFANSNFFDRISLDRLRSVITKYSVSQSLCEIIKNFHIHNLPVNAIFIEIDSLTNLEDNSEFPELVFVDQKIEKTYEKIIKKNWPIVKQHVSKLHRGYKDFLRKYYPVIQKNMNHLKKKAVPIAKSAISNTQKKAKEFVKIEDFSIPEKYRKIKIKNFTIPHQQQSINFFQSFRGYLLNLISLFKKRNTRKYFYLGFIAVLAVIIISNVGVKNKDRQETKKQQEITLSYDKANELYLKAKTDYSLGKPNAITDLKGALTFALQAKQLPESKEKANGLIKNITVIIDKEIKAKRFDDSNQSYKIADNITKTTMIGSEIYGGNDDGKIYVFDIRDRESRLVSSYSKDEGNPISIASSESLNKVFILTSKKKLITYDTSNNSVLINESPDNQTTWGDATTSAVFSTNIYLLDSVNSMIWKHSQNETGYNKASKYFDSSKKIDLKNAIDLSIDGNLYVLLQNGEIMKFSRNNLESQFTIRNIPSPDNTITNPTQIFTSEDSNKLYILDQGNNRILATDKSGEFSSQYLFDDIKIESFAVNSKLQKLWAISAGKVYELGL